MQFLLMISLVTLGYFLLNHKGYWCMTTKYCAIKQSGTIKDPADDQILCNQQHNPLHQAIRNNQA
jgi:hypothetical protein